MFNIVLVNPQIPQNTGAIGRICVNCNCRLHIIKPISFNLDDKSLKRAGLDYWKSLDLVIWKNIEEFLKTNLSRGNFHIITTKAIKVYYEAEFKVGDFLLFGSEIDGFPSNLLKENRQKILRIPMGERGRSLNLAVAVGIVVFESIRQNYVKLCKDIN